MSFLVLLAALQAAAAPIAPSPPTDWSATARSDIEAGYALMRDNHPGWVNAADRGFRARLGAARDAGLAASASASDQSGYIAALGAFSTVMGDGHAALLPRQQAVAAPVRWPGFLAAWRGDRMVVVDGEAAPGLGAGSRILACDGVPVAELMVRRLQPRAVRLREAGQWWAYGTRVLTDAPNVAGPPPAQCDIAPAAGGASRPVALTYGAVPGDWQRRFWAASNGGYSDIKLTEPRPGTFLIGLPTFAPGEEGVALYKQLTDDLARRRRDLATARAVVLDLRFNQGGSSRWSRDVATALWGEAAVATRQQAAFRAVEVWWRNASGNIARVDEIAGLIRGDGQPAVADQYAALAARMRANLTVGKDFTVEEPADLTAPTPAPAAPRLRVPVYVIVPGQCASACLDALDLFTLFPDVTLIGAPSSGDSLYMDVRQQALPSGHATAVIPLKVWMGRPRGGGAIYRPRIELRQADWSTTAFLDAIAADLSKRAATR